MSFFDSHIQQGTQNQPIQQGTQNQPTQQDMRNALGDIKANPMSYLQSRGFSIPSGMNDPKQITQHLLRTGQIGGNKLQQVLRMIGAPGIR